MFKGNLTKSRAAFNNNEIVITYKLCRLGDRDPGEQDTKNGETEQVSMTVGNFTFIETEIAGAFIVELKAYGDSRGYFMETYKKADFDVAGLRYDFVQDNQSASRKGVLRGLHFQKYHPPAKIVRVFSGEVFDVAVDLRMGSKTYGKWVGTRLSAENRRQLLIPRGFAHGFLVLSDYAEFVYKCDEIYHPEDEGGIAWNDPDIAITWPDVGTLILSEKDKKNPTLAERPVEFQV